jgi:hypothetical protein
MTRELKSIDAIAKELCDNQEEIFSRLDQESIDVYMFLRKEYSKGPIEKNYVFQFVFRSFYRLDNAGLSKDQKTKFFELLSEKEIDLRKIISTLYDLPTLRGLHSVQFSFASKLLHTIDETTPIWDQNVKEATDINCNCDSKEGKIDAGIEAYQDLQQIHMTLADDLQVKKIILSFKLKFKNCAEIPDAKALDFILWTYGGYLLDLKKINKNKSV